MVQSYCWVFTDNSIAPEHILDYSTEVIARVKPRHAYFSVERAPSSGKLHVQGCLWWPKRVTLSVIKEAFNVVGANPHLEPMKGRYKDQAMAYCAKTETHVAGPFEFGTIEGQTEESLKGIPPKINSDFRRVSFVVFGPHKTLKTTFFKMVLEYLVGDVYFVPGKAKNSSGRWLSDYQGQRAAIIDEFDYDADFDHNQWKQILDRVPQNIASGMGGKSVMWQPEWVILLSNDPIGRGHPFLGEAFSRRIDKVLWWKVDPERVTDDRLYPRRTLNYDLDSFDEYKPPDMRRQYRKAVVKEKRKDIEITTEDGHKVKPYQPRPMKRTRHVTPPPSEDEGDSLSQN